MWEMRRGVAVRRLGTPFGQRILSQTISGRFSKERMVRTPF
jgi:hypothetical protein